MKINVKRSDLLRFHSIFYNSFSATLNKVYFTFCPNDFFLLAKIISSALSKNINLRVQHDNQTMIQSSNESKNIDKSILQDVLKTMDDSAFLNDHGTIDFTLSDSSSVLILLENLLLTNDVLGKTYSVKNTKSTKDSLTDQMLFSIGKKLGYTMYNQSFVQNATCFLNRGHILNVADDSGVKTVQVESVVEPLIYIVSILKVKFGNEHKFPYGKKYAAVLLRDLISGCESSDKVCLFEYFNGLTKPLFCSISHNGTIISQTDLNYNAIIDSCLFTQGN